MSHILMEFSEGIISPGDKCSNHSKCPQIDKKLFHTLVKQRKKTENNNFPHLLNEFSEIEEK